VTGADYPGQIARREGALFDYLAPLLSARGIMLDHAQTDALERLQVRPTSSPRSAPRGAPR